ncbi:hypothetical protein FB561_7512 [Kribbella amoyensis]|uniref:Uncharacterized protein n=1 Tax=Kribbella amoyensis TaxID=996641 RepID=A0A561B0X9_9ACTN|nr:hypothetical protein FB561_7512 [Kribbella amoyensis]
MVASFWERDDADAVAAELGGEVRRERFHGEDDDEDHPWTVVLPAGTDAAALDELVAEYDGWLTSTEDEAAPDQAPPPLPTEPRRLKR